MKQEFMTYKSPIVLSIVWDGTETIGGMITLLIKVPLLSDIFLLESHLVLGSLVFLIWQRDLQSVTFLKSKVSA